MIDREPEYKGNEALWWVLFWIVLAVLVCGFGFVKSARAATYAGPRWVRQSASGGATGADSSNALAIATFNSNATAGDVALLVGNFTTAPAPAASGDSLNPIVYRSALNSTGAVTIGASATIGTALRRHIWIRSVTFGPGYSLTFWSEARKCVGANLVFSGAGTGVFYGARQCRLDSITASSTGGTTPVTAMAGYTSGSSEDTLRNSSFSYPASTLTASDGVIGFRYMSNCLYERNRVVIAHVGSAGKQVLERVWNCNNNVVRDCYFESSDYTTGSTDEPNTFWCRDSVYGNWFLRDTIVVNRGSHGRGSILLSAQGTVLTPIWGNRWTSSVFKCDVSSEYGIQWQDNVDGDSISYCTFINGTGLPVSGFLPVRRDSAYTAAGRRASVFVHNTVANVGGGTNAAFTLNNINNGDTTVVSAGDLVVKYNVFYSPGSTCASRSTAVVSGLRRLWGYTNHTLGLYHVPESWDYNLYWTRSKAGHYLLDAYEYGNGIASADYPCDTLGATGSWYVRDSENKDANSIFGSPAFTDSSYANFNPMPAAGSPALFSPDGYVGSTNNGSTADVTHPSAISDLSCASPGDSTVYLLWTALGDDSTTYGLATSYDIRRSTSTITQANFGAATSVMSNITWNTAGLSPFIPSPMGSREEIIVNGLTPGTTYYFAIKSADEVPNWSPLSNVASTTTTGGDTQRPAPTTTLVATATSTTSIRLSWTSVGDDSLSGTPASYTVKRSGSTINEGNFAAATTIGSPPAAAAAGTIRTLDVTGLSASTTYYFALKTTDDASQTSAISNVVSCATMTAATSASRTVKLVAMRRASR